MRERRPCERASRGGPCRDRARMRGDRTRRANRRDVRRACRSTQERSARDDRAVRKRPVCNRPVDDPSIENRTVHRGAIDDRAVDDRGVRRSDERRRRDGRRIHERRCRYERRACKAHAGHERRRRNECRARHECRSRIKRRSVRIGRDERRRVRDRLRRVERQRIESDEEVKPRRSRSVEAQARRVIRRCVIRRRLEVRGRRVISRRFVVRRCYGDRRWRYGHAKSIRADQCGSTDRNVVRRRAPHPLVTVPRPLTGRIIRAAGWYGCEGGCVGWHGIARAKCQIDVYLGMRGQWC